MQTRHLPRTPGEQRSVARVRAQDEPLNDWALIGLLGGIYLGGLTTFVGVALAIHQVF